MTANRVIFAVMVMIRTGRRQTAVMVGFRRLSDGVLPSYCFAAFPKWRSSPFSAALSRSLHGGGHGGVSHSDGHSVVKGKKEAGTPKPAPAEIFVPLKQV